MKVFVNIVLVILLLLAVSSGAAKVLLMPQDVEFFGRYGFTSSILITFGALQLLGGSLLAPEKTRIVGAVIVGFTFCVSAVFLVIAGNILLAVVTLVFIALLGFVIQQTIRSKGLEVNAENS